MTMKRTCTVSTLIFGILLSGMTIFFFYPADAHADAPQDVKIQYDAGAQTLTVTIAHASSFPGFHHIKTVEVRKNSAVAVTSTYDSQPDKSPFSYTYKLAAAPGDKLDVTVTCNLSGSKTVTLTVSKAAK